MGVVEQKWAWPITRCLKLRVITRTLAALRVEYVHVHVHADVRGDIVRLRGSLAH